MLSPHGSCVGPWRCGKILHAPGHTWPLSYGLQQTMCVETKDKRTGWPGGTDSICAFVIPLMIWLKLALHFHHHHLYLFGGMLPFLGIFGASMHQLLPFRPLRNTHLKCLLVSFLTFVPVFVKRSFSWIKRCGSHVRIKLESGRVYCLKHACKHVDMS